MSGLELDPRIPPLVEIDEPTRQHLRRVARRRTPCARCGQSVTPETVVLVNGNRDGHRHCAEHWNAELFSAWDELRSQDQAAASEERAKTLGLAVPTGGALWTPKSAHEQPRTPAAADAAR